MKNEAGLLLAATVAIMVLAAVMQCSCAANVEAIWMPHGVRWSQLPVNVVRADDVGQLENAVKWWNEMVGCEMIAFEAPRAANVLVQYGSPTDGSCGAWCNANEHKACACLRRKTPPVVEIYYLAPTTIDVDFCVLVHELGHAIGLADDYGRKLSVMRPDGCGDLRGRPLLVTSDDRAALREWYCQGGRRGQD